MMVSFESPQMAEWFVLQCNNLCNKCFDLNLLKRYTGFSSGSALQLFSHPALEASHLATETSHLATEVSHLARKVSPIW